MTGAVFVPGVPIPQGSAKGFNVAGHVAITHANTKTMPWRADVAGHVRGVIGPGIVYPAGPVRVRVLFVLPRRTYEPVFWPPGQRVTRGDEPHTTTPDIDKCVRAVLDALTGLVYRDDAQVVALSARKRRAAIGEQTGAHIRWDTP